MSAHEFTTDAGCTVSIAPDEGGSQPNALVLRIPNPVPGTSNARTAFLPLSRDDIGRLRTMLDHYDEERAQ